MAERGSAHLCTLWSKCWRRPSGHRRMLAEVHMGRAVLGSRGPPQSASRRVQALSTLPGRPQATSAMLSDPARLCPSWPASPSCPCSPQVLLARPPSVSAKGLRVAAPRQFRALPYLPAIASSSQGPQHVLPEQGGSRQNKAEVKLLAGKKGAQTFTFQARRHEHALPPVYFHCTFVVVSL